MTAPDSLAELEQRVTEKLTAALPKWDIQDDPLADLPPFESLSVPPLPEGTPQFPRERWLTYPGRRVSCLVLADRLIDHGKLAEAGWLVQFGGKARIS